MHFMDCKIKGKVVCEGKTYCTEELIRIVNNIKGYIQNYSSDDEIVAIAMPRCVYLLTAVLALIESGITYLLIDIESQPVERTEYILNDAGVNTVLSISTSKYEFKDRNVICVDTIEQISFKNKTATCDNELAYILYTSGTTGTPKGVEISRGALNNFIAGITEIINFRESEIIISLTSPSFDIFFLEAILPIYLGLTVVLASSEQIRNPKSIINLIKTSAVNILQTTPSTLRLLYSVEHKLSFLENIHTLMIGGEVFPSELLCELQKYPNLKIYNMYGPTETTIWSSIADLSVSNYVHLGKPICNTEIYLLDNNLNHVKNGEVGEICISGDGLADGYHNKFELTKMSFCKLPNEADKTIYRTGDIGVVDENGRLLYIGRRDNQIKYHGYRIELEEIEHHILLIENINAVSVSYDIMTDNILVFYLCSDFVSADVIKGHLREYLPEYMIPSKYIHVDKFCYTISGKIDKQKMLEQYHSTNMILDDCETSSFLDIRLAIVNIVSKILCTSISEIDVKLSLSELGFDSITYVQFIVDLESYLDIEFDEEILSINYFRNLEHLFEIILDSI